MNSCNNIETSGHDNHDNSHNENTNQYEDLTSVLDMDEKLAEIVLSDVQDPDGIRSTLVHLWSSEESTLSNSPSSSQGMLQTPDFNQLTLPDSSSSEQPQPINNTATLKITIQPENTFRFRYDSEILKSHGHLRGHVLDNVLGSAGNNLATKRIYPTVDLVFKQDNQDVVSKYFLRCILLQAPSTPTSSTAINRTVLSPHKLLRRWDNADKGFIHLTELYESREVAPEQYRFEMTDCLINCQNKDNLSKKCDDKYQSLIEQKEQKLVIVSKLIFDEPTKLENESAENQDSALGNCANGMSTKRGKKTTTTTEKQEKHNCDNDDKGFYDETVLYELRKVSPRRYTFEMKNFLINCQNKDTFSESCTTKYQSFIKQNLVIGSKLIFDEPMKLENESSENQDSALGNCANEIKATTKEQLSQVQIGFEVFQFIDNSYKSIAEPIFSNTIINGGRLNIIRNTKMYVLKDEWSEVTLLVSTMKPGEIKIHIKECDIENPWSECILVNENMFHYTSAIAFHAPPYGGTREDAKIECSIQLERSNNRSNAVSIFYCNDLKRKRPIGNDNTKRPICNSKSRKIDQANAQDVTMHADAALFTEGSSASKVENSYIVTMNSYSSCKIRCHVAQEGGEEGIDESMENRSTTHMTTAEEVPKIPYTNLNKNLELLPGSVVFSAETSNQIEQTVDKGSKDLFNNLEAADNIVSFLCELRHIYNLSKNKPNGANKHERQRVQNLFLAYECQNPLANSVLHDVLEDSKLMKYDIVLHKIIEHYKLEDIISKSSNIYGETALMYACIFKRPLLLSALVNMGTSFTAQDVHGNNVLHLVIQQKQPQQQISDCLNALKQLMKIKKHSNHFIEALGGYNVRGLTPLHLAVLQNNVQIVADFLDLCKSNGSFEVCLRGQLSDGNTILHLAVLNRLVDMRECILKHSADDAFRNVINFADQTAEDMMNMDEKEMETITDCLRTIELNKSGA